MALKALLVSIEETLVRECARDHAPPAAGAGPAAWEAWFVGCADRVDALPAERLEALRGPRLEELLAAVRAKVGARDAPMPAVLMPALRNWAVQEHGIVLIGWSMYDPIQVPTWIFTLLARLDGRTPWRVAVSETEAELGFAVSDDLVLSLYRRGILTAPAHLDDMKPGGMTVIPRM